MEELTEVITAAEFHPIECSTFAYSSSKGTVRLCDMRQSALCDRHTKCKQCGYCFILFLIYYFKTFSCLKLFLFKTTRFLLWYFQKQQVCSFTVLKQTPL